MFYVMPLCYMTNDAVAAVCKDEMDCSCGNGAITFVAIAAQIPPHKFRKMFKAIELICTQPNTSRVLANIQPFKSCAGKIFTNILIFPPKVSGLLQDFREGVPDLLAQYGDIQIPISYNRRWTP